MPVVVPVPDLEPQKTVGGQDDGRAPVTVLSLLRRVVAIAGHSGTFTFTFTFTFTGSDPGSTEHQTTSHEEKLVGGAGSRCPGRGRDA